MRLAALVLAAAVLMPAVLSVQGAAQTPGVPRVGPPRGTIIVVGGGSMGPEIYRAFIDAAGGPDALILTVPNAGGADAYPVDGPNSRGWKAAGARNIRTLFTKDRRVADSDSFVAVIRQAGGIWFEGGRQFRLVDAYAGTKTEGAFNEVLARGGVVGGSSAGASILGDFLVRGAPSNNNMIMDHPGYQKGFAYLRGVGVDQHVVARERLPDLADSIITRYPQLLGISEDEGTAWVIRGDTGTIVGRSKGFVYNGTDPNDDGKPFLTLQPGDVYDLGARRIMARAGDGSGVTPAFVDSLFARFSAAGAGQATVLVARQGKVIANRSFGVPPQARYMPTTTVPLFSLGEMSSVFRSICDQLPDTPTTAGGGDSAAALSPLRRCLSQRAGSPVGLRRTTVTEGGEVRSSVDELYRVSLGLEHPPTYSRSASAQGGAARAPIDGSRGWQMDRVAGTTRYRVFAADGGRQGAWVRIPEQHVSIIILTDVAAVDAGAMAETIEARLLGQR
ncbi:MAG: Type 1 glutamine amidotransferase-like domain-containing protein [Gemmatimonadaceae bacterium]|nr:Type 1 glutamine amidotransferase-like domain-containing protein [Gemmatimonadaceae bacterium]